MSQETTKAMLRRSDEPKESFDWKAVFTGRGIDVGSGDDPLSQFIPSCLSFDQADGDANVLSKYFPADHFDFLHASQVLEHMHLPHTAIVEWLKVVKSGGHVVVTVPDWVHYEGRRWPSVWNGDHKTSWSMTVGEGAPLHVFIPEFLRWFVGLATPILSRFVDDNYDYAVGTSRDQTLDGRHRVECWNEFVLRKL